MPSAIRVVGNRTVRTITAGSVIALKVTGNQTRAVVSLGDDSERRVAGICLFVSGNQGDVELKAGLKVGRLVYIGRGNETKGQVTFFGSGQLDQLAVDLSGNRSSLALSGLGTRSGDAVRLSGHQASYSCH